MNRKLQRYREKSQERQVLNKLTPEEQKTWKFIKEATNNRQITAAQYRRIVFPFYKTLLEYKEKDKTQDYIGVFNAQMRFGKTHSIYRMLIPLYHQVVKGRLAIVLVPSSAEVGKTKKWTDKYKANFDYYCTGDNKIELFSSDISKDCMGQWKNFCQETTERFNDPAYKHYTATAVMTTDFALTVFKDSSGVLKELTDSIDVPPLVLWDEAGVKCIPDVGFAIYAYGNIGTGTGSGKFLKALYKFISDTDAIVHSFTATTNAMHYSEPIPIMTQPYWDASKHDATTIALKFANCQKEYKHLEKENIAYPFSIIPDSKPTTDEVRLTSSIMEPFETFILKDFPTALSVALNILKDQNEYNRNNWMNIPGVENECPRNMMLSMGNNNEKSGRAARTFMEWNMGIGILKDVLSKFNAKQTDTACRIHHNQICLALEKGNYLLSDEKEVNPLTNEEVERKTSSGEILILVCKNKFTTGFDCSRFLISMVAREYAQENLTNKGCAISVQKGAQSCGRSIGTFSGISDLFGWEAYRDYLNDIKAKIKSGLLDNEVYDNALDWIKKNNRFYSYMAEGKHYTADAIRDYLESNYPSTGEEFELYLIEENSDLLSPETHMICECPNCNLKKGHAKAA